MSDVKTEQVVEKVVENLNMKESGVEAKTGMGSGLGGGNVAACSSADFALVQQVEIEARVVAATRAFAQDIGTELGFAATTTSGRSFYSGSPAVGGSGVTTTGVPMRSTVCRIWRWRLVRSTESASTSVISPTPAAARYIAAGDPSPPAPMMMTCASIKRCCASMPISSTRMCRE